ncbi:MAG: thioredoxin family protein [Gammaproteobacteria bacterium]|nr:thioredoxin family protein [Gammaproteobacteria bacterium]MDE0367793.1 thioredoxin family protein [Gammaproteobacteria bacterium]
MTLAGALAPASANAASSTPEGMAVGGALLFAFVGGLILNLMPCVFPVLSIKALSLVEMPRENRRLARQSGALYTAGILVAFAAVGGALLALRAAGQAAGWGFQLQNPAFNLVLGLLMLAIGLNLLGVFEVGSRIAGTGESLTAGGERRAAFFTGLLAVVVATPCTAPFMAGALGYALMQPGAVALAIFLSLGLGLAAPYLLISLVPAVGRVLPRPGPWMSGFRNVLAFPMFATGVWLFWIIGKQAGVNAMAVAFAAALCFGFALWAWGRSATARPWRWRTAAATALVAAVAVGATVERPDPEAVPEAASTADSVSHAGTLGLLQLERFSPERMTGYIDAQQPLFVYFTADWCVNCKVNERVALSTDEVGDAFAKKGIKVLVGDWTNEDPVITEWLQRYGRAGVPLYLYFPKGASLEDAAILPQVLLPEIVIQAIERADVLQRFGTSDTLS